MNTAVRELLNTQNTGMTDARELSALLAKLDLATYISGPARFSLDMGLGVVIDLDLTNLPERVFEASTTANIVDY